MGEWADYRLSDFLMFSPQTYWQLVERHNAAHWPAQAGAVLAGAAALAFARARPQLGLAVLALAWGWVGWAFHARRYAEIFLAAPWLGLASGAQALLLAIAAVAAGRAGGGDAAGGLANTATTRAGVVVALAGVAAYPLLAPLAGRPWAQAEVFGFMPDPTALATLGFLLASPRPRWQRGALAVVPALSLLVGTLTRSQFA